jgi:hypothetical protein
MKKSSKPAKRGRPPSDDPHTHYVGCKLNDSLWTQLDRIERAIGNRSWIMRKALAIGLPVIEQELAERERARLSRQRA